MIGRVPNGPLRSPAREALTGAAVCFNASSRIRLLASPFSCSVGGPCTGPDVNVRRGGGLRLLSRRPLRRGLGRRLLAVGLLMG